MKKAFISLLGLTFMLFCSAQSLETVTLQINDLEEAKTNLRSQIMEIDSKLEELYTLKHDLNAEKLGSAHPAVTKSATNLYDLAQAGGDRKTLARIPKGTDLVIERKEWSSYKTSYAGMTGYIIYYSVEFENSDSKDILEKQAIEAKKMADAERNRKYGLEEQQKQAERKAQLERERQEWKAKLEKLGEEWKAKMRAKYSPADANRIIERKIWIGMTKEMMIDSWGQPEDINRTVGSWGTHEQCIYGDTYVYIENGTVTSWQD